MLEIGQYNNLEVVKKASIGYFLNDGNEDVLLPQRYAPDNIRIGDKMEVFVYLDNENRPVATTLNPLATVGEFAFLKVLEVNEHGAFLDWGIDKDIFSPYSEQRVEMKEGREYLVYIFVDEKSGRIAASSKWKQFMDETVELEVGEEVELIIAEKTDLGYNAIINNTNEGLIYKNEVFEELLPGEKKRGYIKLIREDGKVDLTLQQQGYAHIVDLKDVILKKLGDNNGIISLGDKSSPDEIYRQLKISKKAFKKAIGGLYKDRLIEIDDHEIRFVASE